MFLLIQSFIVGFSAAAFPGAIQAAVFQNALIGKFKDSLKLTAGVVVMNVVVVVLSYLGLAKLIKITWLFYIIGFLGVGYVLFLGVSGLINGFREKLAAESGDSAIAKANFVSGALLCVLSPYTYLFFIGFVSSSLAAKDVSLFWVVINALSLTVGSLTCYSLVALLGALINKQNNKKIIKNLHIITALLMIFFGIKMFMSLFTYGR